MSNVLFTGCATALITPFKKGEIDYPALQNLVEFQVAEGVDAIVACGTTGEPSTMTAQEWEETLSFIIRKVNHQIPLSRALAATTPGT